MQSVKYISPIFSELYTKRNIIYQGNKLKTVYLFNIIDMFLNRWQFYNKDNIKLNSRTLKVLYGSMYTKYIEYLIDNEFIYLWKNYSVGTKSKCYRLTDKAKDSGVLSVTLDIPLNLINKQHTLNNNINNGIELWLKNKLIKDLYKIDIDINQSKEWINKNINVDDKSYLINLLTCNKIHNKDIYYSFDLYGRFHTNYTVLKKEIRNNYLTINKEKIKELDITNSQPFFLYLLMLENGFNDFEGFDKDVLSGKIYDKLKDIAKCTRKEAKINVYSVLFGRNITKDYWNELFNNLYPNVYQWIKTYKYNNKSYKIIAQLLQQIESDFIFNKLIPRILSYQDMPIITIHDSVIIPEKYYNKVKIIFDECKEELIPISC